MGLGGDTGGGGATSFVAFFARWKIGANFMTSSSGAEESELLSESDAILNTKRANANELEEGSVQTRGSSPSRNVTQYAGGISTAAS